MKLTDTTVAEIKALNNEEAGRMIKQLIDGIRPKIALEVRKKKLYDEIALCTKKYDKATLREFFNFWSELNRSKTKMRCEGEDSWEIEKRLDRWARNQKVWDKNQKAEQKDYKPATETVLSNKVK